MSGFRWHDDVWRERRRETPLTDGPLNIYEVHPGSWRRDEDGGFLNYRQLADRLAPYVRDMGYNAVELLPVTEYPLDDSWGYQCVGYFAPTSRYGEPHDFMYLVDRLHRAGLAVILDWVPAHFCKDAHGLIDFDGTSLYEYADPLKREHEGWGTRVFDFGKDDVRSFLLSSARWWMEEYHVDGLRVDAVASMLYLDYGRTEWRPNVHGGHENLEAISFLQDLNRLAASMDPPALTAAEESTAWPKVTWPIADGGLGFGLKWNMGWMNDVCHYLKMDPWFRQFHHKDVTFSMMYAFSERFVLPLSHDEVVYMKGSLRGKMPGDDWRQLAGVRSFTAYMLAHPGKKLNFMGNELAHFREWDEKRELDWNLLEYPFHDAFQKYFAALSRTYASEPALYDGEYNPDCFEWVANESCAEGVYAWLRKGRGQNLLCVMNTQDHAHKKFPLYLKFPCSAELVLDTEAGTWGGVHKAHRKQSFHTTDGGVFGRDYTLTLDLPAMGSYLLRLSPEAPNPDAARLSANRALAQKRKAAKAAKAAAEVSDK